MKRKLSKTKEEANGKLGEFLQKYKHLQEVDKVTEERIKDIITLKLDQIIQLNLRKDPTITFYYPEHLLFHKLQRVDPKSMKMSEYYSNIKSEYTQSLIVTWEIEKWKYVEQLFGNALRERNYPDSTGKVNFKEKCGGRLRPIVSSEHILKLSYNTRTNDLKLNFYYEIEKGFEEDGKVFYKTII
jgi:hypothetical protein